MRALRALRLAHHVPPVDARAPPPVGASSPVRIRIVVVLPAPFGPSSPHDLAARDSGTTRP